MSLIDSKVIDFIDEVDSSSPAPGGGSVSALVSTLGVSLSRMVGHLTLSKKKYLELDEYVQNEYKYNFNLLKIIKEKLTYLVDEDTIAFNKIMEAIKLPKTTEEELNARKNALEQATLDAIKVPLEVANLSYKALEVIEKMVRYSNKNAISDVGVGVVLLEAGLVGAILNVRINLSGVSEDLKEKFKKECSELINHSKKVKNVILDEVNNLINL